MKYLFGFGSSILIMLDSLPVDLESFPVCLLQLKHSVWEDLYYFKQFNPFGFQLSRE